MIIFLPKAASFLLSWHCLQLRILTANEAHIKSLLHDQDSTSRQGRQNPSANYLAMVPVSISLAFVKSKVP